MKILTCFFCLFWGGLFGGESLDKREHPIQVTTSVIIPCVAKHFPYIFTLLLHYQEQTYPPEQIVISVSEIEQIHEGELILIEDYPWKFELKILKHREKKSAGQNRNLACKRATGDIILCQDADDIPHPQRVQIVKYIFEHYYVDHLLHAIFMENPKDLFCVEYNDHLVLGTFPGTKEFPFYKPQKVFAQRFDAYWDAINDSFIPLTSGNPSFTQEVARRVHWDEDFDTGEDERFNELVYELFDNKGVARAFLYKYRISLSSFNNP